MIHALARAVRDGVIHFDGIAEMRSFLETLRGATGIDEWTAQYIAMHALDEPDAFPSDNETLVQRSEAWRPWRAYAAMYLSEDLAASRRGSR